MKRLDHGSYVTVLLKLVCRATCSSANSATTANFESFAPTSSHTYLKLVRGCHGLLVGTIRPGPFGQSRRLCGRGSQPTNTKTAGEIARETKTKVDRDRLECGRRTSPRCPRSIVVASKAPIDWLRGDAVGRSFPRS